MGSYIEEMFRDYRQKQRELGFLRQRLRGMEMIADDEVILSMLFSSPQGEHVQTSSLSDTTAQIATHYRIEANRLNKDLRVPTIQRIVQLESELRLFDWAAASLPERLSEVVRCLVQSGDDWETAMHALGISRRTLQRWRKEAICEIERLYSLLEEPAGSTEAAHEEETEETE